MWRDVLCLLSVTKREGVLTLRTGKIHCRNSNIHVIILVNTLDVIVLATLRYRALDNILTQIWDWWFRLITVRTFHVEVVLLLGSFGLSERWNSFCDGVSNKFVVNTNVVIHHHKITSSDQKISRKSYCCGLTVTENTIGATGLDKNVTCCMVER